MKKTGYPSLAGVKRNGVIFSLLLTWIFLGLLPVGVWAAEKPVDMSTAIVRVAKQAIPFVVHIDVTEKQEVEVPAFPFEMEPFFRHFFGTPKGPRKFKREMKGVGTGIIMDAQGHILTNHHVAGGATKLQVTLSNGSQYQAKLVGTDPKTDLAVIKISAKERLPFATLGDSDKMEVGEWVIAIGSPRGLDQTVTQGILSAKHRRGITEPTSYQDFLQTDAAINPGNSGGPLLNLQGEVIGIASAIASESGGFEGIGFAIPSNMALYVSKALMAHGKVERGWLGVTIQDVKPEAAQKAGLASPRGAQVMEVVKGSPAERAGLKKGDIVIAFQGKEISNSGALRNMVAATPVGQEVKLTVLRDGKKMEHTIKISSSEAATKALAGTIKERLGVTVRPLSSKEAEKYGLNANQGVVIVTVEPKGPLGLAGFEVQDLILDINGQPITSYENFVEMVSSLPPKQKIRIFVLDHRTSNTGYIEVTVR